MNELYKPRPDRWLRFSLRSLFLLVLFLAVPLGWAIHAGRQQGIEVAALTKVGCEVEYDDYGDPFASADRLSPTVLESLRKLLGEEPRSATEVSAKSSQITDDALIHVRALTQVIRLGFDNTQVTGAGLVHLQGLPRLRALSLGSTPLTEAGMVYLGKLTQVQYLLLDETQVTDAGLAHLRGLTKLRFLCLNGTQVTDAGLAHLEGLTQLVDVFLHGTQVTDAGVQRLHKALPNCTIHSPRGIVY